MDKQQLVRYSLIGISILGAIISGIAGLADEKHEGEFLFTMILFIIVFGIVKLYKPSDTNPKDPKKP